MNKNHTIHYTFAAGLCTLMAIALQCQVKLFQSENYFGLRINLADILLPFAGFFILGSLLRKKSQWPSWHKPFSPLYPLALCAIMGFALLYGYAINGEINNWALVNKGAGWIILMAYLATGAWISTNFNSDLILKFFIKPLVIFFNLVAFGYCGLHILFTHGISLLDFNFKMDGLMGNRNAFAFVFLTCAAIVLALFTKDLKTIGSKTAIIFWTLLPACLLLNGSRTMWIGFIAFAIYATLIHTKFSLRHIALPICLGLIVFLCLANPMKNSTLKSHLRYSSNLYTYSKTLIDKKDLEEQDLTSGDHMRFSVYKSAFKSWLKRPILGNGLGGSLKKQKEEHGKAIVVVHNTLLWLLSDMGLVGALVFLAAYIAMLRSLLKTMKSNDVDKNQQALAHAALLMLLIFGIFSIFHEMLYMRFMWFILGLALASPVQALGQNSKPDPQKTA